MTQSEKVNQAYLDIDELYADATEEELAVLFGTEDWEPDEDAGKPFEEDFII